MIIITIYTYTLKYVIKEINLLVFKCVKMFHHKSKGKVERVTVCRPPRHARARPLTCLWYWFYLILIYVSSFIIILLLYLIYFIIIFVCRALPPPDTDRRPLLML
jgi:hypothetical protein